MLVEKKQDTPQICPVGTTIIYRTIYCVCFVSGKDTFVKVLNFDKGKSRETR